MASGFQLKTIRIFLLIALGCLALAAVVVVRYPDPIIELLSQGSERAKKQKALDRIQSRLTGMSKLIAGFEFACPGDPFCQSGIGLASFQKVNSVRPCEGVKMRLALSPRQATNHLVHQDIQAIDLNELRRLEGSPILITVVTDGSCLPAAAIEIALRCEGQAQTLQELAGCPHALVASPQLVASEYDQASRQTKQLSAEDYRKRKAEERLQVEEETKRHSEEMLRGLEALAVAAVEPTKKAFPDLLNFDLGILTASVGKTARLQDGEIWVNKRQITKTGGKIRAFEFSPGLEHLYVLLHVGFHEDWGIYPEGEKPPQAESLDLLIVGVKTRSLKRVFQNDCGFDVPGWRDSGSIQFSPSSCAEAGPMLLLNLSTNQISKLDEMDPDTRPVVRRSTKEQILR